MLALDQQALERRSLARNEALFREGDKGVTWLNVLPFSIISTMASHRCSIRRHSCAKPVVKSI
jgi:hypothetical protein